MSRTARSILYGVTLGVLLALLIAPQSGWLVRFQALSLLRFAQLPGYDAGSLTPAGGLTSAEQRRINAVAASHPNDYQIQYATTPWNEEALRALETRFPNSASLHANIMLLATHLGSLYSRPEETYLIEEKPTPTPGPPPVNKPAELVAFDRDAAAGERLDPDNAYFPFMRAIGLYAAHKDAQARAAILRAGTKAQWKEYWIDEVMGQTRLHDLAFGDQSAVWHAVVESSEMFPHYSLLQGIARFATYQAMRNEQTGNVRDGVALRHALIHCGGLMRAQSQSAIGSLVGRTIAQTAMQRPGGVPWVKENGSVTPSVPAVDATYVAYLNRAGFEAEAQYALAEGKADQQALTAIIFGIHDLESVFPDSLWHLTWCWVASLILLSVIPWLLLLRVLPATLAHTPAIREARPLPGWVSWGGVLGILAALGVLLFMVRTVDGDWEDFSAGFLVVLLMLIVTLPVLFFWRAQDRQFQRRSIARGLGIAALTCAGWCGIYALAQWQSAGLQDFVGLISAWMGNDDSDGPADSLPALHYFAPLIALTVPLLLIVTIGVVSRVRRVPVSTGLVSGCRAACLPLACVLLLAYGGMILVTLHQERIVNGILTQRLRGEGAYVAARIGRVWPGVVPER